ncbi:protoporphyrinogen oxidase [Kribbia dieselivorans]|uniref:protoporphyrinogen oxidase n=1 Tax=Kribbia dieselivorans TaxID=331526 RepID=UPI00083809B8|nr:protoporphyrinogen oxidase [Kribbia dieselivorans]
MARRVVVIGGGIGGLTAGHALATAPDPAQVTVVDAADRVGGKLRRELIGGSFVDVGAESVLNRSTETKALVEAVGLSDRITHPTSTSSSIWSRGVLVAMPKGTMMGVPATREAVAGILTPDELAQIDVDAHPVPLTDDVSVAAGLGAQLGRGLVDRLVEPLLGGVYAGQVDELSLQASMPLMWQAATQGRGFVAAVREMPAPPASTTRPNDAPAPFFFGLAGGIAQLPEAVAADLEARGHDVRTSTIVRELRRTPAGTWEIVVGPTTAPEVITADAVVIATPPPPTARLLADIAPQASAALAEIPLASMAIITLVFDRAEIGDLPGSGFLVPAVDGRTIKASTFSSGKWGWVDAADPERVWVRASIGRAGESADLQRPDLDLVDIALRELGEALGRDLPTPLDRHVQRWGGGLPQYNVGHVARIERVRADVAQVPDLELVGAAYDGVGIAAVVAGAGPAAARLLAAH